MQFFKWPECGEGYECEAKNLYIRSLTCLIIFYCSP